MGRLATSSSGGGKTNASSEQRGKNEKEAAEQTSGREKERYWTSVSEDHRDTGRTRRLNASKTQRHQRMTLDGRHARNACNARHDSQSTTGRCDRDATDFKRLSREVCAPHAASQALGVSSPSVRPLNAGDDSGHTFAHDEGVTDPTTYAQRVTMVYPSDVSPLVLPTHSADQVVLESSVDAPHPTWDTAAAKIVTHEKTVSDVVPNAHEHGSGWLRYGDPQAFRPRQYDAAIVQWVVQVIVGFSESRPLFEAPAHGLPRSSLPRLVPR